MENIEMLGTFITWLGWFLLGVGITIIINERGDNENTNS